MFFNQDQIGVPLEGDLSLTVVKKQKFTIREISPEWGYTTEATKVIIGDPFSVIRRNHHGYVCSVTLKFLFRSWCHPLRSASSSSWKSHTVHHFGNRESCSEVKEFDYQILTSSCIHDNSSQTETTKSRDELLLLVRFVQLLLSDPPMQKGDDIESGHHLLRRLKADDELWGQVIEALLVGSRNSSGTIEWLMQELLKDTLQQWLSSKSMGAGDQPGCSLSKKE